ncbi:MAG: hypothetical protein IH931_06270 [candidate division Zixibacteria bacterium]|nr:hypothetical protein [candidate division Zixibacteria bacterium]
MSKQLSLHRIIRAFAFLTVFVFALSLISAEESNADTASYDPWYYVDASYKFSVPDKFQHFWGSVALTEILGPMPALAIGIGKEIYDDKKIKVGFSSRDIVADILGVISAKLTETEKVSLWLDWRPEDDVIIVQIGIGL